MKIDSILAKQLKPAIKKFNSSYTLVIKDNFQHADSFVSSSVCAKASNIEQSPIKRTFSTLVERFGWKFDSNNYFKDYCHYLKSDIAKEVIKKNSNIRKILYDNNTILAKNVPADKLSEYKVNKFNDSYLIDISNSHLKTTLKYLNLICGGKGVNVDVRAMAYLHDIGKAFIPEKILKKQGQLESWEREIVSSHSQLGYEFLKAIGVDKKYCEAVRDHHKPVSWAKSSLACKLSVADVFSALKENRVYRAGLSDEESFKILYNDVQRGMLRKKDVDALKKALIQQKINTIASLKA